MPFAAFLAGERHFTKLFEPAERRALQGFFWSGGRLVLSILDNLKPVFEVLTPSEAGWARDRITGLPDIGIAHVWSIPISGRRPATCSPARRTRSLRRRYFSCLRLPDRSC
jgi:hypothetical protein